MSQHNQASLHSTLVSSVTLLIDSRVRNSESSNLASNSLFEYLPRPASIVNESISCFSGTIEKLPKIKLLHETKTNTIPRGSRSVIQDVRNIEEDGSPMPETNSHPVHVALLQIEKHLHINKLIEGYNAPCDSLYNAWKTLYNNWECIKEQIHMKSFSEKSRLSEEIEPIVSSMFKYPVV